MDELLVALADPARWRLVNLLAERPRPVGTLAGLAGARQPQTTKHLQALERAGVVSSVRSGQRRIYALRPDALRSIADILSRLADAADRAAGPGETFATYRHRVASERAAATTDGWADGRGFRFLRSLSADPDAVWRQLTDPELLALWWAPEDLRVSGLVFDARPGGRIHLEYRDAEDEADTDTADTGDTDRAVGAQGTVIGRAEGLVLEVTPAARLAYRLSPLLADGTAAFTSTVTITARPTLNGADLEVDYQITDSTVDSAEFVAGIELGFSQSLDKLVAITAADTATAPTTNATRSRP